MKNILVVILLFSLISCSQNKEEKIIDPKDYAVYLNRNVDDALATCNEEMAFWKKKLEEVPESETYRTRVAGMLSARFMLNGKIEDVQASDSLYRLVMRSTTLNYASLHRALASNCITQHKFREARNEIKKALEIGEGRASSLFQLVDVNIELGDYAGAKTAMKEFINKNFFPYVIREAKLKDHEGKLDSAILLMEKALVQVKDNETLTTWTQSNLGDMYGHAGRIPDAYRSYLQVLKINPDYDYALKGIAWIAFSHDHNNAEAKRIATIIAKKRATPDMHLLLAQIAKTENDEEEKNMQLELFRSAATELRYGDMYNKYVALLEAEEFSNPKRTIEIAQREISNRPTPQSYDLLAWGRFHEGNKKEALAIAQQHVENKTFEPDAIYHLAVIYQANGMNREALHYFETASLSSFELGPAISKQIQEQLE